MQLTVLCDNNTIIDQYFLGEPAVSYFIEGDGLRILFDAGYSDIFLKNAAKRNIDLNDLTHIILSHGHNDHTLGLKYLFAETRQKNTPLICHPDCLLPKFYDGEDIGSPYKPDVIENHCEYRPSAEPVWLNESCVFLGEIPRTVDFEPYSPIGTTVKNGEEQPDALRDDTAIAFKTEKGIFIVTGCSHSGICNICEYAKKVCGDERIRGVIGGFHLMQRGERVTKTAQYLKSQKIARLYPCHCVPLFAKIELAKFNPIKEIGVGTRIDF